MGVKVRLTLLAAPVPTKGPAVEAPDNVIVPVPQKLSVCATAVTVTLCVERGVVEQQIRRRLLNQHSSRRVHGWMIINRCTIAGNSGSGKIDSRRDASIKLRFTRHKIHHLPSPLSCCLVHLRTEKYRCIEYFPLC